MSDQHSEGYGPDEPTTPPPPGAPPPGTPPAAPAWPAPGGPPPDNAARSDSTTDDTADIDGVPTTNQPAVPLAPTPPGAPPAWSQPVDPPTAPVPQYGAPPAAPPAAPPGAPPGAPPPGASQYAPPQYPVTQYPAPPGAPQYAPPGAPPHGTPQYAPPQYGAPPPGAQAYGAQPHGTQPHGTQPYGAQPYGTQPQFGPAGYGAQQPLGAPAPPTETSKPKRTGLIVALVIVGLLVVAGIAGVALLTLGGSTDLALTIDTCEIAADGTLSASGTVEGPSGTGVEVQIDFIDTATGDQVDSSTVSVDLGTATPRGDPWTASGTAGDQVQQVSWAVPGGDSPGASADARRHGGRHRHNVSILGPRSVTPRLTTRQIRD